jgi:hypothetical protein
MLNVQVAAWPLQSPPHDLNAKPFRGAAFNFTSQPSSKPARHDPGQTNAAGVLLTMPPPRIVTTSVRDVGVV